MLFQKKRIQHAENERLVSLIEKIKGELDFYENMIKNSIEPSEDVLTELKKKRAIYIFLLKEARYRGINGFRKF